MSFNWYIKDFLITLEMEVKSEIFSKRLIFAFFLNIVLQIFLAVGFIFIIQVDLLHPFLWITSTIDDIFGWRMGLNVLLLGLVSFFSSIHIW